MAIFLIVLGTVLAISGLATMIGGAPILTSGIDSTLILAGMVGVVGGVSGAAA